MKMLFGTDGVDKEVFATAHGFSEFDIGRLETELRRMYTLNEHQVFLKNTTCEKIFHEYSRAFKPIEH